MLKFFWADINISAAYNQSTIVFPVWSRITSKSQPKSQIVNHTKMAWWTKSQSRFGRWDDDIITFNYNIQWNPICEYSYTTVPKRRMSHRKWRETKHQPSWWPDLVLLGCCLVSLHFLCDILTSHPVHTGGKVLESKGINLAQGMRSVTILFSPGPPAAFLCQEGNLTKWGAFSSISFSFVFISEPILQPEGQTASDKVNI